MIIKFLLPQTDQDARAMAARFKSEGFCPIGTERAHSGFVREVGEENGKIMIIAEVTEPTFVAWAMKNETKGEVVEIECGDTWRTEEIE